MGLFGISVSFPTYRQLDAMDCGPTCLRIIAKSYGKNYSLSYLRDRMWLNREGVSFTNISDVAEQIGFRTLAVKLTFDKLRDEVPMPCIAHWQQRHFIVVYKVTKKKVYVSDPAHGLLTYTREEFMKGWRIPNENQGVLLLLETTPEFFLAEDEKKPDKTGFKFLLKYLFNYKKYLIQLFLGMLLGSILQLIFPFLTQSLVDFGINNQNIGFVYTVLLAQLMLFFSRTAVDFIRSWILLHIGTRINISIISDFLIKLMKLPMGFFDTRMIGDILQRIGDHHRIESFLTNSTLNILFSLINLVVFGIVLAIYSMFIFNVFLVGSVLYIIWILFFMKIRRELDYKRFDQMSDNQSSLVHLINGMQEIKLNNAEKPKRWEWEIIQAKLFKVNVKSLVINQYQQAGSLFINELKNIIISFIAAKEVIDGNMTLGMMMAVTYIIGQLNSPIAQLIGFIHTAQDAKISLERLGEIHSKEDEMDPTEMKTTHFPKDSSINIKDLTFQYDGPDSEAVLKDLNMTIPQGKVTAIVGVSGSGKTTLLKLLLKFYKPTSGEIQLGDINLENFNNRVWREKCGVVMQDGYIFSDTITHNITITKDRIDIEKLQRAVKLANIEGFIESLPLAYNTKIGADGHGLSMGQKQRLLIARAIYKNPEYMFFDEATSSLDANNERVIMENLEQFYKGRTVVVIAHRLSTVKNANQIVVLDKGKIIESGTHSELVAAKGAYFNLVKNQLELGN